MACVGNALVGDDAVGHAVHERLGARLPPGARLELLGTGGLRILDELDGEEALIAVDAVWLGVAPGTIHILAWDALPASLHPVTSHGIGIREAIELGRKLYPEKMPNEAFLVGVEGRSFDRVGEGMTAEVAAAVDVAADRVLELVRRLQR